ncbi:MAG: hypothetical protein GTO24_22220 [candidate division Zixibacteria bacterium]|nr:hypothetical protein [candidate division Zixibacteria bacterium]
MKINREMIFTTIAFFILVCAFLTTATGVSAGSTVTITGTVYEDEWDDQERPTAVVIETADGEEYRVSAEGKGKELLKLGDKNVKATGVVGEDEEGWKAITVTTYEIIE